MTKRGEEVRQVTVLLGKLRYPIESRNKGLTPIHLSLEDRTLVFNILMIHRKIYLTPT